MSNVFRMHERDQQHVIERSEKIRPTGVTSQRASLSRASFCIADQQEIGVCDFLKDSMKKRVQERDFVSSPHIANRVLQSSVQVREKMPMRSEEPQTRQSIFSVL